MNPDIHAPVSEELRLLHAVEAADAATVAAADLCVSTSCAENKGHGLHRSTRLRHYQLAPSRPVHVEYPLHLEARHHVRVPTIAVLDETREIKELKARRHHDRADFQLLGRSGIV